MRVVALAVVVSGVWGVGAIARHDQSVLGAPERASGPLFPATGTAAPAGGRVLAVDYTSGPGATGSLCKATDPTDCHTPVVANKDILPPYRWHELGALTRGDGVSSTSEKTGLLDAMISNMASMLFMLANFIWMLMLAVVRIAATKNWLENSTLAINQVFVQIAPGAFVVLGVLWVGVLARSGKLALKGDLNGMLKAGVGFLVPAAMLLVMWQGAKDSVGTVAVPAGSTSSGSQLSIERRLDAAARRLGHDPCGAAPASCDPAVLQSVSREMANSDRGAAAASPVRLALLGQKVFTEASDSLAGALAAGATGGNASGYEQGVLSSVGVAQKPNCGDYIAALLSRYRLALRDSGTKKNSRYSNSNPQDNAVFVHVSVAWVTGLYEPWSAAEFGDTQMKNLAACHLLEEVNGTDVGDRQITMGVAYPGLVKSQTPFVEGSGKTGKAKPGDQLLAAGHDSVYETTQGKYKDPNKSLSWVGAAKRNWTCVLPGKSTVCVFKAAGGAAKDAVADASVNAIAGDSTKFVNSGDAAPSEAQAQERQLRMANWAACRWNGKRWLVDPRWIAVGEKDAIWQQDGMSPEQVRQYRDIGPSKVDDDPNAAKLLPSESSEYCGFRWVYGHGAGSKLAASEDVRGIAGTLGQVNMDNVGDATTAGGTKSAAARQAYNGYWGLSLSNRLVYGWMALFGAVAYAAMIGGPAIGLLVTSLTLVALLAFFPLVLVAAASGSRTGSKGVRMTVAMLGAKAVFTLLILAVVELHFMVTLVAKSVDTNLGDTAQAGFVGTAFVMAAPLVVLTIMNKFTEALGLGKLTSLRGATGLLSGAAAKASGAGSMGKFMGGGGSLGKKVKNFGSAAGRAGASLAHPKVRHLNEKQALRDKERDVAKAKETLKGLSDEKGEMKPGADPEAYKAAKKAVSDAESAANDRRRNLDRLQAQDKAQRKKALGALGAAAGAVVGGSTGSVIGAAAGAAVGYGASLASAPASRLVGGLVSKARGEREKGLEETPPDALMSTLADGAFESVPADPALLAEAADRNREMVEAAARPELEAQMGARKAELWKDGRPGESIELDLGEFETDLGTRRQEVLVKATHTVRGKTELLTRTEIETKVEMEAARLGVGSENLVVSRFGVALPDPERLAAGMLPPSLQNDVSAAYLPDWKLGESKQEWADRAMLELFENGVLTTDANGDFTISSAFKSLDAGGG